jgi:hypothetical protein
VRACGWSLAAAAARQSREEQSRGLRCGASPPLSLRRRRKFRQHAVACDMPLPSYRACASTACEFSRAAESALLFCAAHATTRARAPPAGLAPTHANPKHARACCGGGRVLRRGAPSRGERRTAWGCTHSHAAIEHAAARYALHWARTQPVVRVLRAYRAPAQLQLRCCRACTLVQPRRRETRWEGRTQLSPE